MSTLSKHGESQHLVIELFVTQDHCVDASIRVVIQWECKDEFSGLIYVNTVVMHFSSVRIFQYQSYRGTHFDVILINASSDLEIVTRC